MAVFGPIALMNTSHASAVICQTEANLRGTVREALDENLNMFLHEASGVSHTETQFDSNLFLISVSNEVSEQ